MNKAHETICKENAMTLPFRHPLACLALSLMLAAKPRIQEARSRSLPSLSSAAFTTRKIPAIEYAQIITSL